MEFRVVAIILIVIGARLIWINRRLEYNSLVLIMSAALAIVLGSGRYTTLGIMKCVYPSLAALSLVVFCTMMYRYIFLSGNYGVLLTAIYFGLSFFASCILALVTGDHPLFDFAVLRPWLVAVRYLMVVALVIIFRYHVATAQAFFKAARMGSDASQ